MARAATSTATNPVALICGEEEYAVKQRAKQLYDAWCAEVGGMDHELVDATVSNAGEAERAIRKLREALQTLPFFGGGKVVWLKDCNFLGDERTASSAAVTNLLNDLAQELKEFRWDNVRLIISAGKVDKRKTFFKTLDKLGEVENFAGLSTDDKEWAAKAEFMAEGHFKAAGKRIADSALAEFVACIGPNPRQLGNEAEKLSLYVGDRDTITQDDVEAIVTKNKQSRAFALADALGDRDLVRVLRTLDEDLWMTKFDKEKSEIGLLYGLIRKVRVILFLKEAMRVGWLKQENDYNRFKSQLERLPADQLPDDKKLNPLTMHPFVLFRSVSQCPNYTIDELIRAMELLLTCNLQLVSSQTDKALVLQQTLVEIVGQPQPKTRKPAPARSW